MRAHEAPGEAQLLDILECRAVGQTCQAIADLFGLSRNRVVGLLHRVNCATDLAESTPPPAGQACAVKPENRDGGMPARWWVAGLRKQAHEKANLRTQRGAA